jgi:hypothetical protein
MIKVGKQIVEKEIISKERITNMIKDEHRSMLQAAAGIFLRCSPTSSVIKMKAE